MPLHKNQILGSVGIVDKVRQVIMMSRNKNSPSDRIVTILKANYLSDDEKKKSLVLEFDNETRIFEKLKEIEITNSNIDPHKVIYDEYVKEILKLRAEGKTHEEIGRIVSRHKSSISRVLQRYSGPSDTPSEEDQL